MLYEKHIAKPQNELMTTGILPQNSNLNIRLDNLLKRLEESNDSLEKTTDEKKVNDEKTKNTGKVVKERSLETFAETCKGNLVKNPASSTSSLKKRSRSTESDAAPRLKEMKSNKERETALKEKQLVENLPKSYCLRTLF